MSYFVTLICAIHTTQFDIPFVDDYLRVREGVDNVNYVTKYLKKIGFLLFLSILILQGCAVGVGFGHRHYYYHHYPYDGRYYYYGY